MSRVRSAVLALQTSTRSWLGAMAGAALDGLFPWICAGCNQTARRFLCETCQSRIRWVRGSLCPICGLPRAAGDHLCGRCLRRRPAFARARALTFYDSRRSEGSDPVAAAIRALKYSRRRAYARPLSVLLAERFPFESDPFDLVVPVPLHRRRLRERGFNQAMLLCREPARRLGIALDANLLRRILPTPPQVGLDEPARRRNLLQAFAVREGGSIVGARVLLIDDVLTSMATADACARALRAAGAERVDVLAVARTEMH